MTLVLRGLLRGLRAVCMAIFASCVRDSARHTPPGREVVSVGVGATQANGTFQGADVVSAVSVASAPATAGGPAMAGGQAVVLAGLASVVDAVRREDWQTARTRLGSAG